MSHASGSELYIPVTVHKEYVFGQFTGSGFPVLFDLSRITNAAWWEKANGASKIIVWDSGLNESCRMVIRDFNQSTKTGDLTFLGKISDQADSVFYIEVGDGISSDYDDRDIFTENGAIARYSFSETVSEYAYDTRGYWHGIPEEGIYVAGPTYPSYPGAWGSDGNASKFVNCFLFDFH